MTVPGGRRGGPTTGMTLSVYRLSPDTGERTVLPNVDPSPIELGAAGTLAYPPCACSRCRPTAAEPDDGSDGGCGGAGR